MGRRKESGTTDQPFGWKMDLTPDERLARNEILTAEDQAVREARAAEAAQMIEAQRQQVEAARENNAGMSTAFAAWRKKQQGE